MSKRFSAPFANDVHATAHIARLSGHVESDSEVRNRVRCVRFEGFGPLVRDMELRSSVEHEIEVLCRVVHNLVLARMARHICGVALSHR